MTGLDTILESIRSEGRRTADGILEKARKDADEILSRGETDASLRREDILRGVENEARDTADRVLSSARREQRRTVLSARQEIIREVIEAAEQYLYGLSDDDYFKVLIGLAAKRAMPQKGEMVLGARDISRVPPDFEEKLRAALPQGAELSVKETPDPSVEGGFILVYGGIEENCTLRALFGDRREQLQDLANKILFAD